MTTVKIKQEFRDRDNFVKVYPAGEICEFEDGRAEELIAKGLAEMVSKETIDDVSVPRSKRGRKTFYE